MQWSGCSVTCGPGTRTRQRLCLDPRPSNGGSDCTGSASETDDCEIISCEGGFVSIEPPSEKTGLRGFGPGPTQTGLYRHRRWLET